MYQLRHISNSFTNYLPDKKYKYSRRYTIKSNFFGLYDKEVAVFFVILHPETGNIGFSDNKTDNLIDN